MIGHGGIETSGDAIVVMAEQARVVAQLDRGTFRVEDPSGVWPAMEDCAAALEVAGGEVISSQHTPWKVVDGPRAFEDAHGRGVRARLASEVVQGVRLLLELSAYDAHPFVALRFGAESVGPAALRIASLSPLRFSGVRQSAVLRPPSSRWRWFRHGWQSWTPTLSLSAAQQDLEVRPPVNAPAALLQRRGELASEEVAVLLDQQSGRSLLLGFVSARQQWTQVQLDASRRSLTAKAFRDDGALAPGETIWSERLIVDFAGDARTSLERYANALAREMGARAPRSSPDGWCSWYYYFTTVTERDVLNNLRFLQTNRRELPVELVQIDDGYQADIGDWTTANEKFPRGMAPLARDISDAGYTPGIWLAPFLAGENSRLFADHPDWMTFGDDGEPALAMHNWNQRNFGLDCSNPGTERWLRELFREVTDGWGYEYLKIDFLYGGALAGRRHDERATRIDAYRRGLAAIREGAGEKRFILGCGAPMAPSVGVFDGQRIGPDVAPWWRYRRRGMPIARGRLRISGEPATDNAIRNILTRSWMHGRLWANDPDCLLARDTRTKLTLPEVQTLATAIAMSGGALFFSDDMDQLSPERLELMSSLLPPILEAAAVSDLLRESMPSTLELVLERAFESWSVVARINWSGRRQDLSVDLPAGCWHAFEFWDSRYYGEHENDLRLERVPPHGVRLFALRQVLERPQLVGSTFHYSMGGREIEDAKFDEPSRTLRVQLAPVARRGGKVFVHASRGFRFERATLDGEAVDVTSDGELLAVALTIDAPSELALIFSER